jgi:hypothetical protein
MVTGNGQLCAEQRRLLAEYNRRVSEWAKAVRGLSDNADHTTFPVLLEKVDKVRAKTQRAKLAYVTHTTEHGC